MKGFGDAAAGSLRWCDIRTTQGCSNVFSIRDITNTRVNQDCSLRRQAEEVLAINPTNPDNLIAGQNDSRIGFNKCGYDFSMDGGKTWNGAPKDVMPAIQSRKFGASVLNRSDWLAADRRGAHCRARSAPRPCSAARTADTNRPRASEGIALNAYNRLYGYQWVLHRLRWVRGYSWSAIAAAGADTLGETYRKLTQSPDGWTTFKAFIDSNWPPGSPSKVTTDNPFR